MSESRPPEVGGHKCEVSPVGTVWNSRKDEFNRVESLMGVGWGLTRVSHQREPGGLVVHQKEPRSLGCREMSPPHGPRRVTGGEKVVGSTLLQTGSLKRESQVGRMGMEAVE